MNPRDSDWNTRGLADELALIRFALEMQIEFYQTHGRFPSAQEIQREFHKDRSPEAKAE